MKAFYWLEVDESLKIVVIEDIVPSCCDKNRILTVNIYGVLLNLGSMDS